MAADRVCKVSCDGGTRTAAGTISHDFCVCVCVLGVGCVQREEMIVRLSGRKHGGRRDTGLIKLQ